MLVVQALRPDRLVSVMEHFVSNALGLKELSPPALSLRSVYKETDPGEPVLIIVSSGKFFSGFCNIFDEIIDTFVKIDGL